MDSSTTSTTRYRRLRARGLTATFFLTLGFVERTPAVVARMARLWQTTPRRDRAPRLERGPRDASRRDGLRLAHCEPSEPRHDSTARQRDGRCRDSKRRLEDRLHAPITSFAYPFGKLRHHVAPLTVELARGVVTNAPSARRGRAIADADDDLCLPRTRHRQRHVPQLAAKVVGAIDWHAHVREHLHGALSERSLPGRH